MKKYFIALILVVVLIGLFIYLSGRQAVSQPFAPLSGQQPGQSTYESVGSVSSVNNPTTVQKKKTDMKFLAIADSQRRATLSNVRVILSLYRDKHEKYPVAVGSTPEQRWQNLSDTIITKEDLEKGLITGPLTQDPRQKEAGYSYDYKSNPLQDNYILKTTLECTDKKLCGDYLNAEGGLQGDLDGIIYGIDCNDPSYCITAQ